MVHSDQACRIRGGVHEIAKLRLWTRKKIKNVLNGVGEMRWLVRAEVRVMVEWLESQEGKGIRPSKNSAGNGGTSGLPGA